MGQFVRQHRFLLYRAESFCEIGRQSDNRSRHAENDRSRQPRRFYQTNASINSQEPGQRLNATQQFRVANRRTVAAEKREQGARQATASDDQSSAQQPDQFEPKNREPIRDRVDTHHRAVRRILFWTYAWRRGRRFEVRSRRLYNQRIRIRSFDGLAQVLSNESSPAKFFGLWQRSWPTAMLPRDRRDRRLICLTHFHGKPV